jgi:hypothetical protein
MDGLGRRKTFDIAKLPESTPQTDCPPNEFAHFVSVRERLLDDGESAIDEAENHGRLGRTRLFAKLHKCAPGGFKIDELRRVG